MSGLINLISQELSKLFILPILSVIMIITSVGLYYFYQEKKIIKYIPSMIIGIIGLVIGLYSLKIFTTPKGLNTAWVAIFLGFSALIGILTCFIVDLVISIRKNYNELEKGKRK